MSTKEKNSYLAITIGPILSTLNLASSPAALWTGSYMFSYLTKTLCKKFVENGVPEENIVSPYYAENCELLKRKDGVGLFHDRIIIRTSGIAIKQDTIEKIKDDAIEELSVQFKIDKDYLKEYVMMSHVEYEDNHAILGCAKILDCLELAKPFVCEDSNKIFAMFVNEGSEHANEQIKKLPIIEDIGGKWQLYYNNKAIKSLENIANANTPTADKLKKNTYYAIVRSDGDNMSSVFKNLTTDEEIRNYSYKCLEYCSEVADLVKEYGGVTIYSGGDDLLALMPLEKNHDSTSECDDLFKFIKKTNQKMKDAFEDLVDKLNIKLKAEEQIKVPTLSFGISINFMKHPLYEAMLDSQSLLFGVAKRIKNCTALRVQKHAGQSEGIIINNSALDELIDLKQTIDSKIKNNANVDADKVFLSAIYKLTQFESFFDNARDSVEIQNLFDNFFDADAHTDNDFLKKILPNFFMGLVKKTPEYDIRLMDEYLTEYLKDKGITEENMTNEKEKIAHPTVTLCYILRILKLYYEKAGEKK